MTPLEAELRRIIALDGPILVDRYMQLCLGHPQHGYYVTRDPFGARGDFTTAPEISQMFGELIGAWAATVFEQMGAPPALHLVELGPGRGTLMADALRATRSSAAFRGALSVHLIETSPILQAHQQQRLAGAGVPIAWHNEIGELPHGPLIAVANEFVDALLVSQFVKDEDGWHARMVGLRDGQLSFMVAPDPMRGLVAAPMAPVGAVIEIRHDWPISALTQRLAQHGGAALIIDYGHAQSGYGDTLQAVRNHKFADPLADPGEADLTAQVDFAALAATARRNGARVHGPVTQAGFLRRLGIEQRAARLAQTATPQQGEDIAAALARLTAPDQMGELFKVLGIAHAGLALLPGFDS